MEGLETIPQTLQVDAVNHAWKFIQENSLYGMSGSRYSWPFEELMINNSRRATKQYTSYAQRFLETHLRRRASNNKLKRCHKPMKRQAELTDLDKMVKHWKKHRKRKGINYGRRLQ